METEDGMKRQASRKGGSTAEKKERGCCRAYYKSSSLATKRLCRKGERCSVVIEDRIERKLEFYSWKVGGGTAGTLLICSTGTSSVTSLSDENIGSIG